MPPGAKPHETGGCWVCADCKHNRDLQLDLGPALRQVLSEVVNERMRQFQKWGMQDHDDLRVWISVLGEEFGEAATEANDHMLGKDGALARMRTELVQVAAVAVAAVQSIDRLPVMASQTSTVRLGKESTYGTKPGSIISLPDGVQP